MMDSPSKAIGPQTTKAEAAAQSILPPPPQPHTKQIKLGQNLAKDYAEEMNDPSNPLAINYDPKLFIEKKAA